MQPATPIHSRLAWLWNILIAFGILLALTSGKFFWPGSPGHEMGLRLLICGALLAWIGLWGIYIARRKTCVNRLPLPRDLLELMDSGRWRLPDDTRKFDALFPVRGSDPLFFTLDYMPFENRGWRNQTDRMWLGTADRDNPPGDIDPKRMVLIADLGTGYDQPIALDYRTRPPRVLTLQWSFPAEQKNRWIEIAPNIRAFAELVGLTA